MSTKQIYTKMPIRKDIRYLNPKRRKIYTYVVFEREMTPEEFTEFVIDGGKYETKE